MAQHPTIEPFTEDDDLLTVDELSTWLKVPKSWVYERVNTKKGLRLPHIKLGHYLRFEKAAVNDYLKKLRKHYAGPARIS